MSLSAETGRPRLVVITGPTAAGKTAVALPLARKFNAGIISADSMQVYRYLDIGTAKPTREEQQQVPHHLIDCVNPDEWFNAARFREEADLAIGRLHGQGRPVFVVGGTGLYIRVLLGGLLPGPGPDEVLRGNYKDLMALHGKEYLYEELRAKDPAAALTIDSNDAVRIIRALEYFAATGCSITEAQGRHGFKDKRYEFIKIGISPDRDSLFERIDGRAAAMIAAGLVEETRELQARGYGEDLKPMQSLGYKHIFNYLKGVCSLEEAQSSMARDTRKYAKRQLTWFRAEKDMTWMSPDNVPEIERRIAEFLSPVFLSP
ncbi:MAG: tRNA (adenosine(37)-N6)-dimethylallyltransferase MiaA [Syntrophales bacterium]|jgi:tRNA dimethylallyltransferase